MKKEEEIEYRARQFLAEFAGHDYGGRILEVIKDDVVADVEECADEEWSDDDVRMAIGRAISKRLGAEV